MKRRRQIIALGGAGFSFNSDLKLCSFILAQSGARKPAICYIPTASGDSESGIARFYKLAERLGAKPSHLSLFTQPLEPLASFVARNDVIYVGGGNTRNMLLLWSAWGLNRVLRVAYERGAVLAGSSAGGLCWFACGVTDSFPGRYAPLRCLGWLRGSFCPHYDSEPKRKPVYRRLVRTGELPGGHAADDRVALHYVDERLHRIVSSKKEARAYRLAGHATRFAERVIVPDFIA
jgi:dipeptidase E